MNYTSSGNRIRKASFSEIVKHSNWYLGIAITLYILLLTIIGSQVKLWSYFDKSKELRNEWYTDKSTQFKILSKLQTRDSSSSDNLIFLLQDTKTSQKLTLNVNAKTYLDHEKGDKVWFTVCKADYYKDNLDKIPNVIPGWFVFVLIIVPCILWLIWGLQDYTGEDSDDYYNCYVYSISRVREINRYKLLMNLPMVIGFPLAVISPILYAILY